MTRSEIKQWILRESPTIEQQIIRWLDEIDQNGTSSVEFNRGVELADHGLVVLLRPYTNRYSGLCFSICTVRLPPEIQHKGWFKSFLKLCCELNPWNDVIIEDVENPYLLAFCKRNRFEIIDPFYKTTYIVNIQAIMALEVRPLGRYNDYL
ncbi:hypothetical protein DR73_4421 [Enterobacteriaceae bacterium ATCC 29904]|nr:hypothetical protein DR73_4421 [Enterobacteriaceae bacterium ATCC 29904]